MAASAQLCRVLYHIGHKVQKVVQLAKVAGEHLIPQVLVKLALFEGLGLIPENTVLRKPGEDIECVAEVKAAGVVALQICGNRYCS